jgi:AcrR family transcriptional regulator
MTTSNIVQVDNEITLTNKKDLNRTASQKAILDAARQIFAENGYDGTTTKAIANKANCAEGLIFKYYRNKQGLFTALLIEWHKYNIDQLQNLAWHPDSLEDELLEIITWSFHQYQLSPELNKIGISQRFIGNQPPELAKYREVMIAERADLVVKRLTHHQQQGRIAANIDLSQIYLLINSYALVKVVFKNTSKQKITEHAKGLVNILINGIVTNAASGVKVNLLCSQ